jgi:hypothetical protein
MNPVVRFAQDGRREVVGAVPPPRVTLRVSSERDDLNAARGILFATLLGIGLWSAIFLVWFIWN